MKAAVIKETLLYQRTRFGMPPPWLGIIGAVVTGFGLFGWLAIVNSNLDDDRVRGLCISVLLATVLLGVFFVVYGYWRQPVFRFYETQIVVDGCIPQEIEYSRVVLVHIDSLDYQYSFIFPLDELTVAYYDDSQGRQAPEVPHEVG